MYGRLVRRALAGIALALLTSAVVRAQDADEQTHDMSQMDMSHSAWTFMQDGVFNTVFNHQGSPRGGNQVTAVNWWMGMVSRSAGSGQLTFTGMFSLEPATVGTRGYRELFQAGEATDGRPNIDLAFMHRASAAAIVFAPLGHHTFDATHISFGVVTGGVTHGRWAAEASAFNGREPDQNRWGFDFGRLDSVSGRLWFRPADEWAVQVSAGRLVQPEQVEAGNVIRTTASASWTRARAESMSAMTVAYGRNDHASQQAAFGELTRQRGTYTLSSRLEFVQVENELLIDDLTPALTGEHAGHLDLLGALTVGAIRRVGRWRGVEGGFGVNVSAYAVPSALHGTYGAHPFSFQLFVQIRPRVGAMGPMWNMRMGE